MASPREPAPRRTSLPVALLAALTTVIVLAAGIVVLGRIAPGVTLAMVATAAWFGIVALGAFLVARRRRGLLLPMAAGFVLVGGVATVILAIPMFVDREVDEEVVVATTGAPEPEAEETDVAAGTEPARPRRRTPARNVLLARGDFEPREHAVQGRASIIRLAGGGERLTLTDFEVDNGPDLRVYLVTGSAGSEGDVGEIEDLGALKGNRGDQQYVVPRDVDTERYDTAVIWCRAFSVNFAAAPLVRR